MSAEKQKTILLVEDEAIVAMAEKTTLEKYGYKVNTVYTGEEAVALVKKTPAIDLILMDINLGAGIDGTEAAAAILKERDLPIVFLSSHMEPEVVAKTEKITSYGYVVKDSSGTVLDASIKMAFKLFVAKIKEKEKEDALRESEERFRTLYNNSTIGIYRTTPDGRILLANPALLEMLGYSSINDLASRNLEKNGFESSHPRSRFLEMIEKDGFVKGLESSWMRKDHSIIFVRESARAIRGPQNNFLYFDGTAEDITERKQAEETYRNIFLNAQTGLFRTEMKTGLILDANDCVARFIGCKDREELLAKPFNIAERYVDMKDRERMVSLLKEYGHFDNFEARFRRNDGSIIWMRFAAKMVPEKGWIEGVSQDITKEKALEESLRESKERYRSVLNTSPDGISITNMDGRIVMASPALVTMIGCEREEEMLGRLFSDFVSPDDRERVASKVALMFQGTMMGLSEYRGLRADGSAVDLEVNGEFIRHAAGRPTQMVFIIRNVSERKQAEEELRKSEGKFRAIFDSASDGMFIVDLKTRKFLICNTMCMKMLGYTQEEFSNLDISDIHPKEDLPFIIDQIGKFSRGEEGIRNDIKFKRKNGSILESDLSPALLTIAEEKYLLIIFRDISERKQAEFQMKAALEALKVSEAHAQALLRTIPDMLFRVNRQGVFLDYKADVKDLYIQSGPSIIGKRYRDILPPEFADLIDLKIRATLETGGLQTFEYQLPVPGRGERDYEARMVVSGTDEVTAIIRDISEYNLAEKALQKSELQLKAMLDNSPVVVLLIQGGNLTYLNPAAEKIAGWKMEEFLGKSFTSFVYKDDIEIVIKNNRERMGGNSLLAPYIIRINKKTGGFIYAEVNGTVIDLDGKPTMLGFLTDITERKQAEEEIERQLLEKETLLKEVHHRIKNNIASISGLISLHMQTITNPEAVAVLKDAIGRVDSMRILYDKLLLSEDYKDVSVKKYLDDLIDTIVALFPDQAKIKLDRQITDFHLDAKRLFPFGSIINELLTNIMKYAFVDRKTGLIKIGITNVGKHVTLTIQDNGRGLPAGFDIEQSKGFGLMLVKMLSQQLGASFSIKKQKGTMCKVEFDV